MIAVDTSALIAILLEERQAKACRECLVEADDALISAGTAAEAMIVSLKHGLQLELTRLIESYGLEIIPVTAASARRIGNIYAKWGKGFHPAGLNYGDCFAYELAESRNCKLLFIGNDFSKTDITPALA